MVTLNAFTEEEFCGSTSQKDPESASLLRPDTKDTSVTGVSKGSVDVDDNMSEASNYEKGNYDNALPSFLRGYIGSALLAMPFMFHLVGIAWGILLTFLCCLSNQYVMNLIVSVCDDCGLSRNAWGKMCRKVSGPKLQLFAEIALVISQLGMCIGESIFVLKFLNYVFCQLSITSMCQFHLAHTLMLLAVVVPLTAITNMYFLSLPNRIADYVTIFFIIFVIGVGSVQIGSFHTAWIHFKETFFRVNIEYSLLFCGTLLYAIGGVGAILDVRASMADRKQFHRVLRNGMIIVGTIHACVGSFGYLAHGENTQEIYLFNLPLNKTSLIIQGLFLFTIPMTYITNQFPVMSIVERWIDPKGKSFHPNSTEGGNKMRLLRHSVRYTVVAIIITIASLAPSFNLFLSFIGSFNFAIMNGLIPVVAYTICFRGRMSLKRRIGNALMLIITLVIGFFGMVQSLDDMINIGTNTTIDTVKIETIKL